MLAILFTVFPLVRHSGTRIRDIRQEWQIVQVLFELGRFLAANHVPSGAVVRLDWLPSRPPGRRNSNVICLQTPAKCRPMCGPIFRP